MSSPEATRRTSVPVWDGQSQSLATEPLALMSQVEGQTEKSSNESARLDAHKDARQLVRLIQCTRCFRPLRTPVTLPCGKSLCRQCLPESHERQGITYPTIPERRRVITCPISGCGQEHPVADCSVDVTLTKVMEAIEEVVVKHRSVDCPTPTKLHVESLPDEAISFDTSQEKTGQIELPWSKLIATYILAIQGGLPFDAKIQYANTTSENDIHKVLDVVVLRDIVEAAHSELDCQVCYNIMLDPVTTFCGHTLCRKCMARVVDHSYQCPLCRRGVAIPTRLDSHPSNKTLVQLLESICPDHMDARREAVAMEERGGEGGLAVPLFVCALAFPGQPTFLRIFEPRYRLMLRRCLEGNREFGMLMYNRYTEPQGELGHVHFWRYGTMLRIGHVQPLPDGTSLVETTGAYRFRVLAHGVHDGYCVGNIERIDDVPLAEEERIESEAVSRSYPPENAEPNADLDYMSTNDLFRIGTTFVSKMQERSAHWLQRRTVDTHGRPPNDAATFPFWFAAVLPFHEEEKYKLLPTQTVRERLKIIATWIRRIESQRW